ncbi:hypothetical protein PAAG_12134 [Paracoccidioides lutzii Pb01]|uniref:Major facilitator superfamily (MFS) profile domain-containing protein n=1 Tax=Paracoccidioides lutzii (strain ATCC MYA-826 / Pb01) TaxID=502779 RepID=A0A0A2VJZ6_PARBA|nr:hypothetical protein PAAG_12134 [Paracoccidioides lutzii Pb01]KGQ01189.1 hypothetical protein PAAG_12134 [Paracoccidioides lutzii Pb01]
MNGSSTVSESTQCSKTDTPSDDDSNGAGAEKGSPHLFNEQTNFVPRRTIITIFLACASLDLLALIDQTTLAASLSIISNDLAAGDETLWIAGGYFVTSTCFQLLYGRFSDIWSRKVILYIGLVIFFIGSLASSLSRTAIELIVFRALSGIGGGGLITLGQLIVSDVVPLRERGKYQGILGSVVALANGIGPVIGGSLASISKGSWRWIFRLNLPLTVLAILSVKFFMPLRKVEGNWRAKLRTIDFTGAFLALGGTVVLMLGLAWGGEYPWNSIQVVISLVVGVCVSLAFVVWQWKGASTPLIPMHIFKSRLVNGACLTMFINGWNSVVQLYYIPTFYQLAYGYSATKAASLLLPVVLVQTVGSSLSGLFVSWVGRYRECILLGWVIWAIGLGLYSTLDSSSGLGKQIGYGLLTGAGVGNTLQPALIAIQAGVERREMAVVTSFRNFLRNLGGTLGITTAGVILHNVLVSSFSSLNLTDSEARRLLRSPDTYLSTLSESEASRVRSILIPSYQKGFRIIFLIGAGTAALAFFLAIFLIPQVALKRPDDDMLKEEGKKRAQESKNRSAQENV